MTDYEKRTVLLEEARRSFRPQEIKPVTKKPFRIFLIFFLIFLFVLCLFFSHPKDNSLPDVFKKQTSVIMNTIEKAQKAAARKIYDFSQSVEKNFDDN